MALVTETNQQYYAGAQPFRGDAGNTANQKFTTTFNTDLVFGSHDPNNADYIKNNFKIYTSTQGIPGTWSEYTAAYTVSNNVITITGTPGANIYIVVQLKSLDGGKYGNTNPEKAFGDAVEENYGSYSYIKLGDIIDNFMVGYVGDGKVIQTCKKSDVVFFAKRSLQEFSYDTLKSIKSQELTIPDSLSLVIPQDYVNYVSFDWIDSLGVKHPIYPANNLTTDPYSTPLQDDDGIPTQDNLGENLEGTSQTIERWGDANTKLLNGQWYRDYDYYGFANPDLYSLNGPWNWGRLYGIDPKLAQSNGWFGIDERDGKFTFSSNLRDKLIVVEYVSDGLAYDLDSRVPKLVEDAMYKSILYNIVSVRANQPEGIVQRYKKDRYAALRNAKIRLSNIKLDEFIQVMRGKSKWIKH
jgi:hypothetical protein|tara:strand:+ start:1785 stop:3017 length:1233 start_codon:yes stop_codon:yes gene_type:complete